jgi:signal transduction histidine kinase
LIDNAIKYSPSDSEVIIESKENDEWIIISVQDSGIGMTEEEKQNLFTRFYRAKNDTTTAIPGTGLGLYLTKYFIEAHRGRVEVDSEKNNGSTFRIFLPINEDSAKNSAPSIGLTQGSFFRKTKKLKETANV